MFNNVLFGAKVSDTDTIIAKVNKAAANTTEADEVHAPNVNTPKTGDVEAIDLFNIESADEYDSIMATLSKGNGVSAHVTASFDRNRWYRVSQGLDAEMVQSINRRKGIYSARQQAAIDAIKGTAVYPRMIDSLCRNASAYIMECFMSVERPEKLVIKGDIELTKDQRKMVVQKAQQDWMNASYSRQAPLNQQETVDLILALEDDAKGKLMRQAQLAAHSMEDVIYGQFDEGGWEDAFAKCVDDALTLKKGIIYGPYSAITTKSTFRRDKKGNLVPYSKPRYIYKWDWRSPFDIFPQAGTRSFNDGDLVDRIRYTQNDLLMMKGQPGWRDESIDRIVRQYGYSGYPYWTSFDNSRAFAEKRGSTILRNYGFIEALRFYGQVSGDRLMATGMGNDDRVIRSDLLYDINAIVISNEVVYLAVMDSKIEFRPYVGVSFAPDIGGFWGEGFGEVAQTEDAVQASAMRSMVDNAAFCSRPTSMVDPEQIIPGQTLGATYPGRTWLVRPRNGATNKPVEYFKIDSHIQELQELSNAAEKAACERVGLPYPDMGTQRAAGAGRTAAGFAEILSNMTRPMQDFVYRIERDIWRPNVERLIQLNNMYHEDDSVKTDAQIEPQGLFAELNRIANAGRKLELYDRVRQDPLVTPKKRAVLIRSIGDDQGIPDGALPSDKDADAIEQQQKAQEAAAAQAAQGGEQPGQPQPAQGAA